MEKLNYKNLVRDVSFELHQGEILGFAGTGRGRQDRDSENPDGISEKRQRNRPIQRKRAGNGPFEEYSAGNPCISARTGRMKV